MKRKTLKLFVFRFVLVLLLSGMLAGGSANVSAQNLPPSLSDGLLVYYSFNTYEGGIVTDESGSGNDGTVEGTLTHTTQGKFGGAYNFKKDWGTRIGGRA